MTFISVCNGSVITWEKTIYILDSVCCFYFKKFVIQIYFLNAKIQVVLVKDIQKFVHIQVELGNTNEVLKQNSFFLVINIFFFW